jgi:hypothetical protein
MCPSPVSTAHHRAGSVQCNGIVLSKTEVKTMYQHSGSRSPVTARTGGCGFSLAMFRAIAAQRRREHIWAWASLVLLLVCWDATLRLDQKVSIPRPRLSHMVELDSDAKSRFESR